VRQRSARWISGNATSPLSAYHGRKCAALSRLENRTAGTEETARQAHAGRRRPGDVKKLRRRLTAVAARRNASVHSRETGTGKELVARAIPERFGQADAPFVPLTVLAGPPKTNRIPRLFARKSALHRRRVAPPGNSNSGRRDASLDELATCL